MTSALPLSLVLWQRILHEYEEQPLCLRLTPPQAQRLWNLDGPTCAAVLSILVYGRILQRKPDGRFALRPSAA